MALVKRNRIWSYDFTLFGRRYCGSTKRTNREAARNVESALRLQILNSIQSVPQRKDVPPFTELADEFMSWVKVNLAPATMRLHRTNVADLKKFFGTRLVTDIDSASVEKFKVWRAGQQRKTANDRAVTPATVNRALTTLKRIYSYADAMDLPVRNPVRRVKFLKESAGRMRVLTDEEATKYTILCKGDLQDFAVVALDTGARPEEILSLRVEDVHAPEGHVHVHGTKTDKSIRDIPMTPAVQEVLERRMVETKNGYIFPTRRPKTKHITVGHITSLKTAHKAVIAKHFKENPFVPYDLRHTFATRQVQLGTELPVLAALMGHSDLSTTMRYIHPARELKMAAIDRMDKLALVAEEFKKKLLEGSEPHAILTHRRSPEGAVNQLSAL